MTDTVLTNFRRRWKQGITRQRSNGEEQSFSRRWIIWRVIEHEMHGLDAADI